MWIAPEKGMKGQAEVVLEPADALFPHKLALARHALSRKLPVKVRLGPSRNVVSFAVRLYPSKKQLQ